MSFDRGLAGVRSDDREYHDDLPHNVETYMHGCWFGIAVFDRIEEEEFSPNVSLEVGYMMSLGKDVCLLKDKNLQTLHADLLGKLYKPFDPQDPQKTIPPELSKWLRDKKLGVPSNESHERDVLICHVLEDNQIEGSLVEKLSIEAAHAKAQISVSSFPLSSVAEVDLHPPVYDISYYLEIANSSDMPVLLVSKNFLKYWEKQGLERLASSNILYQDFFQMFLPIFLGVTAKDVQSYSPFLANLHRANQKSFAYSDAGIGQASNWILSRLRAKTT